MSLRDIDIPSALERVKSEKASTVEVIWATHERWPLLPQEPSESSDESIVRISILDSSFNPPTRAHLALALAPHPSRPTYTSHLLLLSVTNAEKTLQPGDAMFVQRIKMMILLAKDMSTATVSSAQNVAVAIIDEPVFVAKSTKLLQYVKGCLSGMGSSAEAHLVFTLGTDTITRFFDPRFYPSEDSMRRSFQRFFGPQGGGENGEGEECQIVCARRATGEWLQEEEAFLQSDAVKPYVDSGGILMLNIGEAEMHMSSTKVRQGVKSATDSRDVCETMCPPRIVDFVKEQRLYGYSQNLEQDNDKDLQE